jgi:glyoxylase-like metal-dependent hydrolase (beta-lactamase superfamily II)
MAKITTFSVGHCTHPACMAVKGAGLASRCFPSRAYLIETSLGLVLWDTGYAERFQEETSKGVYRLYPMVTPVSFNPEQALVRQLRQQGVNPDDIRFVILSHFHADHMAGLKDFPKAHILCDHWGWLDIKGLTGVRALLKAFIPGLVPADIETRMSFVQYWEAVDLPAELAPFERAWDVLGTGELLIVPLPGHSAGHIGAFVLTEGGWTLLASDAAWAPEAYQENRGPSELAFLIQDNRKSYYETLRKLHLLHRAGTACIALTHEAPADE